MRNENKTIHPCPVDEFVQRRDTAVQTMTAILTGYLEASGQEDIDECRSSLEKVLTEWWDQRNVCLAAVDPESPYINR